MMKAIQTLAQGISTEVYVFGIAFIAIVIARRVVKRLDIPIMKSIFPILFIIWFYFFTMYFLPHGSK
jgi:hypothetical protein